MATLEALIYSRLILDPSLQGSLAKFDDLPAVFLRQAPGDTDRNWGDTQYPRVDFNVSRLEDTERKVAGTAVFYLWSKRTNEQSVAVEAILRILLDGTVFHPDNEATSVLKWVRSSPFEVMTSTGQLDEYTVGVSLTFDVMMFPSQATAEPDPIVTLQNWITSAFAIPAVAVLRDTEGTHIVSLVSKLQGTAGNNLRAVIDYTYDGGYTDPIRRTLDVLDDGDNIFDITFVSSHAPDTVDEAEKLTQGIILAEGSDFFYGQWKRKGNGILQLGDFPFEGGTDAALQPLPESWDTNLGMPLVYFRIAGIDGMEWFSWGAWITARIHCHIITPSSSDRLYWMKAIVGKLADPRIQFSDSSTLDLMSVRADVTADQFRVGQIQMVVRFGIDNRNLDVPTLERAVVTGIAVNAMPVPEE